MTIINIIKNRVFPKENRVSWLEYIEDTGLIIFHRKYRKIKYKKIPHRL